MPDQSDINQQLDVYQLSDEQRRRAALRCTEASRDRDEAVMFLRMLGLVEK